MTSEGYIVVGNDTLGHGRSTINDKKNYLGELGSWRYAVEDIKICHDMIMNEYPRLPIYLIGFSMGSFLVRQYLSDYNPRVYSTFLIGTGYQSGFLINMVKKTVKKVELEELLEKLCDVKTYLLDKCLPKPSYKKEVPDEEISKIYKQINQSVKKHQDEKAAILADLLKELRTNRSEVERSLEHYLFVYSATTQQSEGVEIKEAKGINKYSDEHPEYETVIVDEAARVSPADLMIPLAQAKKRIILVGDHRQLPHIYDEEVFESMKENGETVDMNNIKKSMFEYLLEKARELEKIDNVPRTIVLDAQYRMHPMLGEFVNEVFYQPNGEQFASPMPASNYQQFISKKTLPLEWYDFPDKYGKEHKEGTSRVRDCEADFIVEKIEY